MRKTIAAGLTMLIALAAGLTTATPAQAAGACPGGWICFYDTSTSSGYLDARDYADSSTGQCFNLGSSANNKTSYIKNEAGFRWYTYNGASCTGTRGTIYENSAGSMNATYNNQISSYRVA